MTFLLWARFALLAAFAALIVGCVWAGRWERTD
jgi:hypothetical protein